MAVSRFIKSGPLYQPWHLQPKDGLTGIGCGMDADDINELVRQILALTQSDRGALLRETGVSTFMRVHRKTSLCWLASRQQS
jgi:hypothetical protein